ncbi:MAG: hypothetical protein M3Z24_09935, partial [Chloroflexota bacterium]|nr:hypothetical protein [Chloroflexota bacterium]
MHRGPIDRAQASSNLHTDTTVLGVGSRLKTGPAPELVQTAFARELADQLALFTGMSMADLAHTIM